MTTTLKQRLLLGVSDLHANLRKMAGFEETKNGGKPFWYEISKMASGLLQNGVTMQKQKD